MVVSEFRFLHGKGKIIVHYCNICGSQYFNMEEAETCEHSHEFDSIYSKKSDIVNLVNNQVIILDKDKVVQEYYENDGNEHRVLRYRAIVRGVYRENNYEFIVEARNIQEASAKIREKFPRHSGYTLKGVI